MNRLPNDLEKFSEPCIACHGTGVWIPVNWNKVTVGEPAQECEACWGAGSSDYGLNHSVSQELAIREIVSPGYTDPVED